jgi:hypothetical protein
MRRYMQIILILLMAINMDIIYGQGITDCAIVRARSGIRAAETAASATDNNVLTKWYTFQTIGPIQYEYQFCNNTAHAVNSYSITSANDRPLRDPQFLNLSGSNDGINYILLDSVSNISFTSRYQTLTFNFPNNNQYTYYRFQFVANSGNDGLQLSEIKLFENGFAGTDTSDENIFPLIMDSGKLSTKSGNPFLIVGDSPWFLIQGPNNAGVDKYLENRRQKGINSLAMCLITTDFYGRLDPDGNKPFLTEGDFTTPNPKYFNHVDYVLGKALEKGIVVFLYPAWLGYDIGLSHPEGFYDEIKANGPDKMYQYGKYLGQRFKNFKNIIWVMGGDCAPTAVMEEIREMVRGIEEAAGPQIISVHNARFHSGITEFPGETWLDLNTTYSDVGSIGKDLLGDYNRNYPYYFVEGTYENTGASAALLRGQMYKPVLMGANGSFFGNYPLYNFNSGWDEQNTLESQGINDLARSARFFISRSWYNLVPDISHLVLTYGGGDIIAGNYAAAALMRDGSTAIIYSPDRRPLTVDLTKISGLWTHVWWYQPSTGYVTDLSVFKDSPYNTFTPPSDGDWLLVLDDASKSLKVPNLILKSTEGGNSLMIDSVEIQIPRLDLYPNPANDVIYFKNISSPDALVIIYDLEGKIVLEKKLDTNSLNISEFSRGIYIIKIVDSLRTSIHKLIKE